MSVEKENPYLAIDGLGKESAEVLYEFSKQHGFEGQSVQDQITFLRGPFSNSVKKSRHVIQAIHECMLLLLLKDIDAMGQKVEDLAKEIDQLKMSEILGTEVN